MRFAPDQAGSRPVLSGRITDPNGVTMAHGRSAAVTQALTIGRRSFGIERLAFNSPSALRRTHSWPPAGAGTPRSAWK